MSDSKNVLELKIILSILTNIVKHASLAIHVMKHCSLLDYVQCYLHKTDLEVTFAALRLLLELSKHGKTMCEIIMNDTRMMSHLSCLCQYTENEDITLLILKIGSAYIVSTQLMRLTVFSTFLI